MLCIDSGYVVEAKRAGAAEEGSSEEIYTRASHIVVLNPVLGIASDNQQGHFQFKGKRITRDNLWTMGLRDGEKYSFLVVGAV